MPNHATDHRAERIPKTLAQKYCLLAGLALLLAGLFGFIADATFDTTKSLGSEDSGLQGNSFLGFEVNGWHNVVHLLSGIVLLAAANTRPTAKSVAIAFGVVYGLVALVGLVDGEDVLGLIPVNAADNLLHIALAAAGIAAGLLSATTKAQQRRRRAGGRVHTPDPGTTGTSETAGASGSVSTTDPDRTPLR